MGHKLKPVFTHDTLCGMSNQVMAKVKGIAPGHTSWSRSCHSTALGPCGWSEQADALCRAPHNDCRKEYEGQWQSKKEQDSGNGQTEDKKQDSIDDGRNNFFHDLSPLVSNPGREGSSVAIQTLTDLIIE